MFTEDARVFEEFVLRHFPLELGFANEIDTISRDFPSRAPDA